MFATEPQTKTEDQPPTLAEIVREVTDNGRTIIDFLHDAMNGRLDGFEPCHRIAAARELAKRGDKQAIAFLQSFYPKSNGRKSNGRKPSPPIGEFLPDDELTPNDELAEIVREVTDNGRTIVCFLHDAMQGNLDGFKPCHRVACGKELLRRGFDNCPGHTNDEFEDCDDVQQCHDEPFDHKKYAREQFWRDGADGKALAKIYGSEEAVSVALSAVRYHRRRTVLADAHIPDLDYTPIENPEDDPYGKGCYGYDTLRLSFNDNQAIRAANKAAAEYKQKAQHPPVGAGFKPARGLTHPSTERHTDPSSSVILSEAEGPPGRRRRRKKPRKIHLGPPDE